MSIALCQTMAIASETFHMVVIGDSIAWGAGLEEDQKYYSLVRDWIAQEKSIPSDSIELQVLAHTGAMLCTENYDAIRDPDLSSGNPTLTQQVDQISNSNGVDLILVSGGINDIGVNNIINLDHLTSITGSPMGVLAEWSGKYPTTSIDVIRDSSSRIRIAMRNLLNKLLEKCPNAKIVVTDYYPIISYDSTGLTDTIKVLNPDSQRIEDYKHLDEPERLTQLVDKSNVFYAESTKSLRLAVKDANSGLRSNRVALAQVAFKPENSYGADETWLWKITNDPTGATIDDNRFNVRMSRLNDLGWVCSCEDCSSGVKSVDKVDCNDEYWPNKFAAVGHPNERGAIEYKDKITEVIVNKWPDWLKEQDNSDLPATSPGQDNANQLPDATQLAKSLSGLIPISTDLSPNASPAIYIVCIVLALIIGGSLIRRSLWDFVMNAVSGLVVIYLSSLYLGIGIAITIPTLLVCAIGGFPGAIILIALKYFYGITF
jgi:lysophospholipase L1-like esterase